MPAPPNPRVLQSLLTLKSFIPLLKRKSAKRPPRFKNTKEVRCGSIARRPTEENSTPNP